MSFTAKAPSKRSPYPYTFKLNGTGVMGGTKDRQSSDFQSYKPEDQSQASPPRFGYGADNPVFGATTHYGPMRLGMGLRHQRNQDAAEDEQYDHAIRLDASVYPWVKGPDITTFTPSTTDSTNGVSGFLKVGTSLYAVAGRYALLRASDSSWTVGQDFGASKAAVDSVAFYSNAHSAAYGLVAMGDSENFWYVTGGVWAQHASLKSRAFGVAARELYRAHTTNSLQKVDLDADWTVAANWGNEFAFDIGDQSSGITRLPTTPSGILLAIKTDGLYTIQGPNDANTGYDRKLMDFIPDADNGKAVGRWGNELYVGATYSGFWRFDQDGDNREQVGPELLTDGSSVVSGIVTSCHGVSGGASALYAGFYQPSTGLSYLCKFLGVVTLNGKKHPIWHGSLSQAFSAKITAMAVDTAGAAAGHVRLYLGFGDGTLGWFTLPCTAHPRDCPDYRFTTTAGTLRLPSWDGGFGANAKPLDAITCTADNFSTSNYAQVSTRTDPGGSFSAMSDNFDSGQREKIEFASGASGTVLDVQVTLQNTATTASPHVTGLGIHHQLHTPYRQVFEIYVLAANGLLRRDGTPMRLGREAVKDVIEAAANTTGSVTLVLPDETSKQVRIKNPRQVTAFDPDTRRPCRAYVLECVEVTTNTIYGTWARFMAQGSWAQGMNYSWGQAQQI